MTAATDLPDWTTHVGGTSKMEFHNFVAGGAGNTIDVAQYGSVQILLGNVDGASYLCVAYQFIDPSSGFIMDAGLLSADNNHSIAGDQFPSWTLPVVAGQLVLINNTAGAPIAVVIGRPERSSKLLGSDFYPMRAFQANVPANSPVNTVVQLPGQDGNNPVPSLRDCTSYNGAVAVLVFSNGNITGQVRIAFRNDTGAQVTNAIFSNPTTNVQQLNIGHPFAFCTWSFICAAISPATPIAVRVMVIPAEVSG